MPEEKNSPVVIDADAFDPVPRNAIRYRGVNHKAFDIIQVRASTREKVVRANKHLAAAKTVDEQIGFLADVITELVPSISREALIDEPFEKLLSILNALATADEQGEAVPTKGQRRSGSRRNTRL